MTVKTSNTLQWYFFANSAVILLFQITFQGHLESGPPYVSVTAKRLFIGGVKVKSRIGLGRDDIFEGLRDSGRFMAQFFMTPLVIEKEDKEDD